MDLCMLITPLSVRIDEICVFRTDKVEFENCTYYRRIIVDFYRVRNCSVKIGKSDRKQTSTLDARSLFAC